MKVCIALLSSDYWEVPRYSVHWKKHHLRRASPGIHCTKNIEENIHAAGCFTTLLTHFARTRQIHRKVKSRRKVEGSRRILSSAEDLNFAEALPIPLGWGL
jgi:hypothetical protein